MGRIKKEISRYIRECLDKGYSFKKIEEALVNQGYPRRAAEGIILSYKYKGNILKWVTIFSLTALLVLAAFLSGSGIIGMVTLEYQRSFSDDIGLIVNTSSFYSWYPFDKGEITAVAITGNLLGGGDAKVYIENNGRKYLIFDSGLKNFKVTDVKSSLLGDVKHFDMACEDTCNVEGFNKSIYNMVFEVQDSILEIEKINYDVKTNKKVESIPKFLIIPEQQADIGDVLNVDLMSFFNSSQTPEFGYISEDDSISVELKGSTAAIRPLKRGVSHLFFTAELDGVRFVSNLIQIDIAEKGGADEIFVKGQADAAQTAETGEKGAPSGLVSLALLFTALMVIIVLAIVPARFYDIKNIAIKIDGMRRTREISSSIGLYSEMKSQLKNKELPDSEKKKIMDSMEEKLKSISNSVPKFRGVREFNEKCEEFEGALRKDKERASDIYAELRKIYLRLIESRLPERDKKLLYKKVDRYYKKIKL